MKKSVALLILFTSLYLTSKADHITGGEIYYSYTKDGAGNYRYQGTFKLFMRCHSNRSFNDPTIISIFDKGTNQRINDINVSLASSETISLTDNNPCITNPPEVCYVVG